MIKLIEVEFHEFDFTTKAYDHGELQGTWNDGENVQKAIIGYLSPYIPQSLHSSIRFDRCVLDYRFNSFATKVTVGGTEFYFTAIDVKWNATDKSTTFRIVSSDEDTYLKERKLMLKTIEQINKAIEVRNRKKYQEEQDKLHLERLEKNAETQDSYKVYYNENNEIDLLKTSRDALKYHNLL